MKCSHCKRTIPEGAIVCPYCAEPVPRTMSKEDMEWERQELERKAKNRAALDSDIFRASLVSVCSPLLSTLLLPFGVRGKTILYVAFFIFIISIIVFPTLAFLYARSRIANESIVKWKQYCADRTSICPACGSHSVKVYRKGYDWNEAFWGSVFKLRGTRYTAGMDSNLAMCFCKNCGHKWNSHYDYRTIK